MKPLFDGVLLAVIELTAQLVAHEGSQIAAIVDKKLSVRDIVFLGQTMEKSGPQSGH